MAKIYKRSSAQSFLFRKLGLPVLCSLFLFSFTGSLSAGSGHRNNTTAKYMSKLSNMDVEFDEFDNIPPSGVEEERVEEEWLDNAGRFNDVNNLVNISSFLDVTDSDLCEQDNKIHAVNGSTTDDEELSDGEEVEDDEAMADEQKESDNDDSEDLYACDVSGNGIEDAPKDIESDYDRNDISYEDGDEEDTTEGMYETTDTTSDDVDDTSSFLEYHDVNGTDENPNYEDDKRTTTQQKIAAKLKSTGQAMKKASLKGIKTAVLGARKGGRVLSKGVKRGAKAVADHVVYGSAMAKKKMKGAVRKVQRQLKGNDDSVTRAFRHVKALPARAF